MTQIGIISDTHDDLRSVRNAIKLFNDNCVDYVIHAGDYVFPGLILEFKNLKPSIKLIGVLGNNDGELLGIYDIFTKINADLKGIFGDIIIDNLRFGIYHGTNNDLKNALIKSNYYDIFIYGHTHIKDCIKIGKTQVLNPGSAHKDLQKDVTSNAYPSIILLDTTTKKFSFIKI